MTRDSLTQFVRSRLFAGIVTGIGIMLLAVGIFEVGVSVGFHEAQFSSRWGANYERNFGGPQEGMTGIGNADGENHSLPDAHGAFGTVVSLSSSTLTISNDQKQEQKVLLTKDTIIRDRENTISATQLTNGMSIVVVGEPSETGEVTAKLIRVMPAPPAGMTGSTSPNQ